MNFALILLILLWFQRRVWAAMSCFRAQARAVDAKDPWWVEYGASFFPGHPDRLRAALLHRRAVQDSLGLDDSDAAGRRLHPGQQIHLRHPPAGANKKIIDINSRSAAT
jgi:hypothetical protein